MRMDPLITLAEGLEPQLSAGLAVETRRLCLKTNSKLPNYPTAACPNFPPPLTREITDTRRCRRG